MCAILSVCDFLVLYYMSLIFHRLYFTQLILRFDVFFSYQLKMFASDVRFYASAQIWI